MITLREQLSFQRFSKIYAEKTKRLIVFCGAGASFEAGLPNWDDLIGQLTSTYLSVANSSLGAKLSEEIALQIRYLPDNWYRMSRLKELMDAQYEQCIRNLLTPKSDKLPIFYKKIWDLEPHALLSFNLDNLANTSYVQRKLGVLQNHLSGIDAPNSRVGLGDGRPLIVDLHGNIDRPSTWILTKEDRDKLTSARPYIEFLKSMFTHNLVLFYGVSVEDFTVSGQLGYLREVDFVTGDYFILKRSPDNNDHHVARSLPLNFIYMGEDHSWEAGFSNFVQTVKGQISQDSVADPIVSSLDPLGEIPLPEEMVKLAPDVIRQHLATATKHFYAGDNFDYDAYRAFCKRYDTAIHISTRVNPSQPDQTWLGNRISSELGRGNFGRVYQAFRDDETSIAIKVAHMEVRDDEAMLNSFRRGVESMRLLSSSEISGIVKLLDASELPPSIIMEYVQGVDLQKYINDGYAASATQKLYICLWVADILMQCHTHESIVLHRDLRPSNIMITGDYWERVTKDDVRVLDFDLSWFKGASGAEFYMNASQALGFLAPEQIDPKSSFSNRSALVDVYGVGMLLYFMISGEIPLANASARADWTHRVNAASASVFHREWKSTKYLFKELVLRSTNERQDVRPQLPDFIERLRRIIGIFQGTYPLDADSCIVEVLSRITPPGQELRYDSDLRTGGYTSGAGANLELTTTGERIVGTLRHVLGEGANRVTRAKVLNDAMFKARSKLETFAKIDEKITGTIQGGNVVRFSFEAPSDLRAMQNIAAGIDFAVVEISRD